MHERTPSKPPPPPAGELARAGGVASVTPAVVRRAPISLARRRRSPSSRKGSRPTTIRGHREPQLTTTLTCRQTSKSAHTPCYTHTHTCMHVDLCMCLIAYVSLSLCNFILSGSFADWFMASSMHANIYAYPSIDPLSFPPSFRPSTRASYHHYYYLVPPRGPSRGS